MNKTIFISDLHLSHQQPQLTNLFHYLLDSCTKKVDSLYILGDLFEAWIGDDDLNEFNLSIIRALEAINQRGIKVYFMRGNRDFLIGEKFASKSQCILLDTDQAIIQLYGTPTLLMHGDTLCTKDIAYQRWRRIATKPVLHGPLFLALPLRFRRWAAAKLRDKSKGEKVARDSEIFDVVQTDVEQQMQKNQCFTLIHGHTHRAGIHDFKINGHPAKRFVLGDWHTRGSVLICSEDGNKELLFFDESTKLPL